MKAKDITLTKKQRTEIFMRLWRKNIYEKCKNEPPSLAEYIKACKESQRTNG